MVAPVVPSWTGFYFGAHVGAAWQSNSDMTLSDPNVPVPAALRPIGLSGNGSDARLIGGIHGGYNWQFDPRWVLGAEGDISWTSLNNNAISTSIVTNGGLVFAAPSSLTMSEKINWLASLRGRLGFLAWPNALIYATGGAAWANTDYNASLVLVGLPAAATSFSKTSTGFVVGGGMEWQAVPHVLLRAEYLFYDFNQSRNGSAQIVGEAVPINFTWASGNVQVVRVGASYKF